MDTSYSLFGRLAAMSCLDDLNEFYGFYDLLFTAYRSPLTKGYALSAMRP